MRDRARQITIQDLNNKLWYRLLRVIYTTALLLATIYALAFALFATGNTNLEQVLGSIAIVFLAGGTHLLTRRIFFYIVTGTSRPPLDHPSNH